MLELTSTPFPSTAASPCCSPAPGSREPVATGSYWSPGQGKTRAGGFCFGVGDQDVELRSPPPSIPMQKPDASVLERSYRVGCERNAEAPLPREAVSAVGLDRVLSLMDTNTLDAVSGGVRGAKGGRAELVSSCQVGSVLHAARTSDIRVADVDGTAGQSERFTSGGKDAGVVSTRAQNSAVYSVFSLKKRVDAPRGSDKEGQSAVEKPLGDPMAPAAVQLACSAGGDGAGAGAGCETVTEVHAAEPDAPGGPENVARLFKDDMAIALRDEVRQLQSRVKYFEEREERKGVSLEDVRAVEGLKMELDSAERERRHLRTANGELQQQLQDALLAVEVHQRKERQWMEEREKLGMMRGVDAQLQKVLAAHEIAVQRATEAERLLADERERSTTHLRHIKQQMESRLSDLQVTLKEKDEAHARELLSAQRREARLREECESVSKELQRVVSERQSAVHSLHTSKSSLESAYASCQHELQLVQHALVQKEELLAQARSSHDVTTSQLKECQEALREQAWSAQQSKAALEQRVGSLSATLEAVKELGTVHQQYFYLLLDAIKCHEAGLDVRKSVDDADIARALQVALAFDHVDGSDTIMTMTVGEDGIRLLQRRSQSHSVGRAASVNGDDVAVGAATANGGNGPYPACRGSGATFTDSPATVREVEFMIYSAGNAAVKPLSTAALMTSSVLRASVSECLGTMERERERRNIRLAESIVAQADRAAQELESRFATAASRLRQLEGRVEEFGELAKVSVTATLRGRVRDQRALADQTQRVEQLADELLHSQQVAQHLSYDNGALQEELHRVALDRHNTQVVARVEEQLGALSDAVHRDLQSAVEEIGRHAVNTNILTPGFLETMRGTALKAEVEVQQLLSAAQCGRPHVGRRRDGVASQAQQGLQATISSTYRSFEELQRELAQPGGPGADRSEGTSRVLAENAFHSPRSSESVSALALEQLTRQLRNMCVLLENSVTQSRQNSSNLQNILEEWQQHISERVSDMVDQVSSSMQTISTGELGRAAAAGPVPALQIQPLRSRPSSPPGHEWRGRPRGHLQCPRSPSNSSPRTYANGSRSASQRVVFQHSDHAWGPLRTAKWSRSSSAAAQPQPVDLPDDVETRVPPGLPASAVTTSPSSPPSSLSGPLSARMHPSVVAAFSPYAQRSAPRHSAIAAIARASLTQPSDAAASSESFSPSEGAPQGERGCFRSGGAVRNLHHRPPTWSPGVLQMDSCGYGSVTSPGDRGSASMPHSHMASYAGLGTGAHTMELELAASRSRSASQKPFVLPSRQVERASSAACLSRSRPPSVGALSRTSSGVFQQPSTASRFRESVLATTTRDACAALPLARRHLTSAAGISQNQENRAVLGGAM